MIHIHVAGSAGTNEVSRPSPPHPEDQARWMHSATRWRVLSGQWDQDLYDWMAAYHLSPERMAVLGAPDTSSNALKQSCRMQSVTYHQPPRPSGPEAVLKAVEMTGHWRRMPRIQYYTEGMREMLLRPYVDRYDRPQCRRVWPYNVLAWAWPDSPSIPVILWELRTWDLGGAAVYAWDQFDISDPENPTHRVIMPGKGGADDIDITEHKDVFGRSMSGEHYRDRKLEGNEPFIPYAWYHAEETGELWDPYFDREVLRGTLTGGMLGTMSLRAARDLQGNVVLGVNADFARLQTRNAGDVGATGVVAMEAGSLHEVLPKDPSKEVTIHVIKPGADMAALRQAAAEQETSTLYRAGIRPPSAMAQHGDPRSGYAVALDDRSRRELARAKEPQYRAGDQQILALWARLLNQRRTKGQAGHPEDPEDYPIQYAPIPLSPEEERERRERLTWEVAAGVKEAWELVLDYLPGITEAEARIRASRGSVDALVAAAANGAGRAGRGAPVSPIPRNP